MNLIALIIGLVLAAYVIISFRVTRLEKREWLYPALLATFPFYYFVFALYAGDYSALLNELYVGLVFIVIAYVAYKLKSTISIVMLSIGYLGHAVYDVAHIHMFINEGTPLWWPEFCGAVDGLIGVYLVYFPFH